MICKMANGYDAVSLTIDAYLSHNAGYNEESSVEKGKENRDKYEDENKNGNGNRLEKSTETMDRNENENEHVIFSEKRSAAYDRWSEVPNTPYIKVSKLYQNYFS